MEGLNRIVKQSGAEILSEKIAHHEWKNRFKLMVVKRLGPSLVPAEVVIPLSSFGDFMAKVEKTIRQPVVKEGVMIRNSPSGKPEVVILGFIPGDQRTFSYNFVFGLSLSIMKTGGEARRPGLCHGTLLLDQGQGRARRGPPCQAHGIQKAGGPQGHPESRQGARREAHRDGRRAREPVRTAHPALRQRGFHQGGREADGGCRGTSPRTWPGMPTAAPSAATAWTSATSSTAGAGRARARAASGTGCGSTWRAARSGTRTMVDTFLVCTTCELCNLRCSAALPIEPSWMKLRGKLIHEEKKMTFPPFEMMAAAALKEGNIWAGYRKNRAAWFPEDLEEKHGPGTKAKTVYFAGCTASYVEHGHRHGERAAPGRGRGGFHLSWATRRTAAARPCWWPASGTSSRRS